MEKFDDPRNHSLLEFEERENKLWHQTHAALKEILTRRLSDDQDRKNFRSINDVALGGNLHLAYFRELNDSVLQIIDDIIKLRNEIPYFEILINMANEDEFGVTDTHFVQISDEEIVNALDNDRLDDRFKNLKLSSDEIIYGQEL